MATPYFRFAGSETNGVTSASPPWPTPHSASDIGILIVESNWGTVSPTPISMSLSSGFTQIGSTVTSTGSGGSIAGTQLAVFWCRATGSSQSAPTVTGADHVEAQILCFRGVRETGNPYDVFGTSNDGPGTSHTVAGVTTTADQCMVVYVATDHSDASAPRFSAETNSTLADVHEVTDISTTIGGGGGLMATVGVMESSGSTGNLTYTSAGSCYSCQMTISLVPATASVAVSHAPALSNFSPSTNANITGSTVLQFDATDSDGDLRRAILIFGYSGLSTKDIVHDGESFGPNFTGSSNTRSAIANGYRYTVLRDGGWPASPIFYPFAYDGNENS